MPRPPMDLYTFVVTSATGAVLDFGTYYDGQCAYDTGYDSPKHVPGKTTLTIIRHDDDGTSHIGWEQGIEK